MPFWSVCLFNSIWLSAIPLLFLLTPRVNKIYSLCSGHTSSPEFDCLFVYFHFCVIPILMKARWNLNVVLIGVSLMIKENEHFYISLLTTDSSIFVFRNVCSDDFSMFLCFFLPPSLSFSPPLSLSFFLNYYLLSVNIVHLCMNILVSMCGSQSSLSGCIPMLLYHNIYWESLWLCLELKLIWLTYQNTPESPVSEPQFWIYRHVILHPAFMWMLTIQNHITRLLQVFAHWAIFPIPITGLFWLYILVYILWILIILLDVKKGGFLSIL